MRSRQKNQQTNQIHMANQGAASLQGVQVGNNSGQARTSNAAHASSATRAAGEVSAAARPPTERSQLRALINAKLLTDIDLESFCIDYFPEIQRRFSSSMERNQKINSLLLQADLSDLVSRLRSMK